MRPQFAPNTSEIPARPRRDSIATTVSLKEVVTQGTRFDASAYDIESRNTLTTIESCGLCVLPLFGSKGLCKEAHNAFRFRRVFASEQGLPFLTSADIIKMRLDYRRHLSRSQTPRVRELLLQKWDVLISCSGTIGNVALAGPAVEGFAASQDIIRLRATNSDIAGYVAAFLRSRYGRGLIANATYGSVITHIEPDHLSRIPIPVPRPHLMNVVGTQMREAVLLRERANRLLDDAEAALYDVLGFERLDTRHMRSTTIRARELNGRFDARYHEPVAIAALRDLETCRYPISTIGDGAVCTEIRQVTRFRKRVYVERGGIPLLTTRQLFQYDPVKISHLAKGAHEKDLKEIALAPNMVTVNCSGRLGRVQAGTLGRVQIIPRYMSEWTTSQHALRLVAAPDLNAGYLYAWLASAHGLRVITRHAYGSVVVHINRHMMAEVPIPLPTREKRNMIGDLVLLANRLRDEAWRREQTAIRQVEALIALPPAEHDPMGFRMAQLEAEASGVYAQIESSSDEQEASRLRRRLRHLQQEQSDLMQQVFSSQFSLPPEVGEDVIALADRVLREYRATTTTASTK